MDRPGGLSYLTNLEPIRHHEQIAAAQPGVEGHAAEDLGYFGLQPFNTCLAMFLGAAFFWVAERIWSNKESTGNRIIVQNQEPICAGVIAGGALMGIAVILIENFAMNSR